jgi:hypothetical protein
MKQSRKNKLNQQRKKRSIYKDADALTQEMLQQAAQVAADAQKADKERGLYSKYGIRRLDGSTEPGKKHAKCDFFVLDITHDPHAAPAIFSYARSAGADGYTQLEKDLYSKIQPFIKKLNEMAENDDSADADLTSDIILLPEVTKLSDKDLIVSVSNVWALLDGADALFLQELLDRFEKLTNKPKRTRKKKENLDMPPLIESLEDAPVTSAAEVVQAAKKKGLL